MDITFSPTAFGSRGLAALARIVMLAGVLFCADQTHGVTNLYSTRFEAAEGYDLGYDLIGQNGWISDTLSTNDPDVPTAEQLRQLAIRAQNTYSPEDELQLAKEYLKGTKVLNDIESLRPDWAKEVCR